MEEIGNKFENFFNDCKKENFSTTDLMTICQPLFVKHRQKQWKRLALLISIPVVVYFVFTNCYHCAWTLSAVGRLGLIQILPYWNWTPLYNTKCLIQRDDMRPPPKSSLGRYETDPENCPLCESIERIPAVENTTYSYLESNFLERGLPVIVTDSHAPKQLSSLLDIMQTKALDFLDSEPCDLATNIMLKKFFNMDLALQKIRNNNTGSKWFLQFRNCQFRAVKDSRLVVTRPYYYPLHLEPFYTSWLLIVHNYQIQERRLYLQGLVFVQQLSGRFSYTLEPKAPCNETCPLVSITLNPGECLIFSTDIWIFHYRAGSIDGNFTSIATILEIDWHL